MESPLPEHIARRRHEFRKRQVRRRRLGLLAGAATVALVTVAAIGIFGGNPDDGSQPRLAKKQAGGARPDSTWKPSKAPVPILMYHVIGDPASGAANPGLYLSTERFQDQVDWLAKNSYTAVTLIQVQDAWFNGATLPPKPVVLSFDDGYLGQYLDAMPILAEKGWAGQLNLKAEGSDLSSKQVTKMMAAGWEIASHTITHPDLTSLDPSQVEAELVDSKRILERDLGIEIINFCYPAGKYDQSVAAAVEAAGYRGATTVDPGLAKRSEPFELKRIRIDGSYGAAELESMMQV